MTNQEYFALASLILNVVWFGYAMLNSRFLRRHVRRVESQIFEAAPALHTDALELYFRRKRNPAGLMLVRAIQEQLHQKPTRKSYAPIEPPKTAT